MESVVLASIARLALGVLGVALAGTPLVGEAAAQARPVFSVSSSSHLEGERKGSDRWVVHGTEIACGELTFSGEIAAASEVLEVLPEHSECTAEVVTGLIADFYQETCAYVLHDLKRSGPGARWEATVDIRCGGGYDATGWDLYETEAKYREARSLCQTRILEGPDAGSAELRNLGGPRDGIEVHWHLHDLAYRVYGLEGVGASLLCGSPPNGIAKDAAYSGAATIFATGTGEESTGLRVSG
jgi:hypothetical protein